MNGQHSRMVLATTAMLLACSASDAANINVSNDITTSTTWTANNVYNLTQQIYVRNGATLTIQPGTVVASVPTANGSGSLAITRGSMIIANGTEADPIIFTSTADVATWSPLPSHPTGKDPRTGTWREAANEWGNITIMGEAFISDSQVPGNSSTCSVNNLAIMEGLVAQSGTDPNVRYGGNQDNDDSGTLRYVSIRYAGRVLGLGNELNGLSLGGIGRNTDIDHIEIMNNVDDGIEIWGGTVNVKYVNIWNIGDDSFDIDQGWRGKAQFGLIVQGYSEDAAQGSGVGDNIFETDGAEDSDAQPVTTATIYNFTAIGQPVGGDHATAWRDNARVQYRNCIFMDTGDRVVSFDNVDGDGANGYGFNGTLSWANTWTTSFTVMSNVNACNNPEQRYQAQSAGSAAIGQGFLAEITDSVFFRNLGANAYTEANNRGVTVGGGSNPAKGNVVAAYNAGNPTQNMPVTALTRAAPVTKGGLTMVRVTSLNPLPANAALSSNASAPNDGFFTPASYRGAFAANDNWLCGWTAAQAFGFIPPGSCAVAPTCPANVVNSGGSANVVDIDDLLAVISAWGPCPAPPATCPANVVNTGGSANVVDIDDLLAVISAWGPCP